MAISTDGRNPIYIDTTGAVISTEVKIKAIVVSTDTAAQSIVLHNRQGGEVILEADLLQYNPLTVSFPGGTVVSGIYATTVGTNVVCLIYT